MRLPVHIQGEGPLLVMVHGRTSHHGSWDPILPYLEDYRCVRVDLPGHGDAEAPEGIDPYRLTAQVEALEETLRDHPGPKALVGHSMGGWVALRYALRSPGELRALVLEATSASSPFRAGRHARRVEEFREEVRVAEEEGMEGVARLLESRGGLQEVQRARLLMMRAHAFCGIMRATEDMDDVDDQLPGLHVPTLVVCGLDDEVFVPECRRLAERIPGARSVLMPGIGHSPHGDAPATYVNSLRDFLAEYLPPAGARPAMPPADVPEGVR